MKKKGFTLVELLAVIAILAILVIIALPNIMDLFNDAKFNSFKNEVKEIYKTAQSQFLSDSMTSNTSKKYARGRTGSLECADELKLSGRSNIQYGIIFDKTGNVTNFTATDDTFVYWFYKGDNDDYLTIENIGKGSFNDSSYCCTEDNNNSFFKTSDLDNYDGLGIICGSENMFDFDH